MVQPGTRPGAVPLALLSAGQRHDPRRLLQEALDSGQPGTVVHTCWQLWHRELLLRVLSQGVPPEQADDVLQDVFSLLYRECHRVQGPRLRGWLGRMVDAESRRWFSTWRRQHRRRGDIEPAELPDGRHEQRTQERKIEGRRDLSASFALLETLEPIDQLIFEAALCEGRRMAEIVGLALERLGQPYDEAALRKRRARLRRRLLDTIAARRRGENIGGGRHG